MISLWPILQGVYAALTAAPATFPAYFAVPQGATFPYIVIGETNNLRDDDIDADSSRASVAIRGWSRQPGEEEAHEIAQFIRDRLDMQPIGSAWACYEDQTSVLEDRTSTAASRLYRAETRYIIRTH